MSDVEIDLEQQHNYRSRDERLAVFSQIQIVGHVLDTLPSDEADKLREDLAETTASQRRAMAKLGTHGIYYGS